MSRDWTQIRVRIPAELHAEIENEALASGSTMQREILMRIIRGSKTNTRTIASTRAYATVKGELDVASKLVSSLGAVVNQMLMQAGNEADAHEDHIHNDAKKYFDNADVNEDDDDEADSNEK
jgi:hypothetical protein